MSHLPIIGKEKTESIRILMVEDDDVEAMLLQKMLSRSVPGALQIRRTDRLSAALQELEREDIDLILMDLGLPDSQGIDTFIRMRAEADGTPIIILSGLDNEDLATQTVQLGAQDYIVKGQADGASLARAIRYAIDRSHAQQALAHEHDLLRSVIDNIPDQVYVKDRDSRFVAVNPVTACFVGVSSPDQLVGKSDFDFFPHELAVQFRAEEQALMSRDQPCINREAAITDSMGVERWVLTTKVPLRDHTGAITGLLGINRDITERKHAEEAILRVNSELEQRVAARTSELRKAMARLEEHDRARAEFVSNVSHELKTPLTSMKFGIANLLEGVCGPVSDRVVEYLKMLNTECQRMAGTVDDILDLSRLESKTMQLHLSKQRLGRLVQRSVMALSAQAQAKTIGMTVSLGREPGFVECDAAKTMRALINIIGNAIKFTPKGGRVEIGLRREVTTPDAWVVEITDNGIGIAPQHIGKVTERYYRVGEHIEGSGLGLSIVKEVLELHGGRLVITSPPPGRDRGTRVSVSLPAVSPPTVLTVIDDERDRDLLEQQLRVSGYLVVPCAYRDAPIDRVRQIKPDVVILDVSSSDL
ncbi:MAG: ATP-binding protein, partial [bacterium]